MKTLSEIEKAIKELPTVEARITQNYRALALKKGDNCYWVWIGTHDEYELLLS